MTRNKIAIYSPKGLGDGLLMMILSQNLSKDHDVVVFNSNLFQLANWFPNKTILPFPKDPIKALSSFDQIITTQYAPIATWNDFRLLTLREKDFDKTKTMVQNLVSICKDKLHLVNVTEDNGLTLPKHIVKMRYPNRIVIHPMSSDDKKTWPQEKFICLSHKLKKRGYDVALCVASYERDSWKDCHSNHVPVFESLEDFGAFVAESGYVIGNDSGIGHLASNIGIPTLSLFARSSTAKLWRPGFGNQGTVITPLPFAIGAPAKQYMWKKLLPVSRVLKAFLGGQHKRTPPTFIP